MNQAKVKMEFKGQNDKDWSALTAFDECLKDKKPKPLVWLKELVKEYNNDENLKGVLDKIPSKSGWVHAALPQFHEKQGQNCLLVLGFCPPYAEDTWSLKDTEALNAYARLHRKGMSEEQKNARVKWDKAYYEKNKAQEAR